MSILERLNKIVSQNMSLLVIIFAAVAFFIPITFTWVVPKITILLGVIMFGMGMTLKFDDFRVILQRPRDVLAGVAAQFVIMPCIAWVLVKIFNLPPELALGVILVGACPGGTASNVITYLSKGDVALSVSMTMTTTLLSPIVTPAFMLLFAGQWIEISFVTMMMSIVQVVVLPIFFGIAINSLFGDFVKKFIKYLPTVSIIAILLIVGGVVSINAVKLLDTALIIGVAVILHNLCGYALGYSVARILKMNLSKAKAISVEVGMQNSGLATSLAIMHFGAAAAIPAVFFSVWHNISGSLIAMYFSKRN